jgi:phosphoribosylformylglycinamidine (FGAM) synthase-like enzyme
MYIDGNILGDFGERHKISGLETLQFSITSVIDNIRTCVTMDVKQPGHLVYILGNTRDELGGSEYYEMFGYTGVNVPMVNAKEVLPLYRALSKAINESIVASVHGIYRGGLGVHLAQVAFGGGFGLEIELGKVPGDAVTRNDILLFSESAGRFIVTISSEDKNRFEGILGECTFACIGKVIPEKKLMIYGQNSSEKANIIVETPISELKNAWKSTFGGLV